MSVLDTLAVDSSARLEGVRGDPKQSGFQIVRSWPNVHADYADTIVVAKNSVRKVINPKADKQTYSGQFIVSNTRPIVNGGDEGSKRSDFAQWDEANGIVNLDRTRSLDATLSRFYEELNTLPANAREIKDYYDQLKAPVRTLETKRNGITVARYVEAGPDHLAHAEDYCLVARLAPQPGVPVARSRAVKH